MTTFAGKTTVGVFKFMLKVAQSPKKLHILSGLDLGTIEKNIINKELGIIDIFGPLVQYNASGRGQNSLPHISYCGKIIYVLGYDNKARWKKVLGGQYGCIYIDEINTADMEFVREAAMRCDYLMATLNPDNPDLPIYKEYINHSRPLPQYKDDAPKEINDMLTEPAKPGWVHWFFSFKDNASLTPEKMKLIIENVPPGTKIYKNKILGLRGRATGLVFDLQPRNIITPEQARQMQFKVFTAGVDTSYSQQSRDTISFIFGGITVDRKFVHLAESVHNNALTGVPLTPSDVPLKLVAFLEQCRGEWGFARHVFIDSADAGTILELRKYKQTHGLIYHFEPAWKQTKIIDRIKLQQGWMAHGEYLIVDTCKESIKELNSYSWKDDKDEPEDANDHTINAAQYAWLPFKGEIGSPIKDNTVKTDFAGRTITG